MDSILLPVIVGQPVKDGVCKGRPPLSWNCLVFYDKTSLT
jgi:hypothetical protein